MIKEVLITKINPNNDNPRIIRDEKFKSLVKSIKDFPEMLKLRPIIVNEDFVVLGGNMRLKACKEAGLKKVFIIKAGDLTAKQQREFIIKDNVGFGEWEWDKIANEWKAEEVEEWGLDVWVMPTEDETEEIQKDKKEVLKLTIECENTEEFEQLKQKLDVQENKISCAKFLIKAAL